MSWTILGGDQGNPHKRVDLLRVCWGKIIDELSPANFKVITLAVGNVEGLSLLRAFGRIDRITYETAARICGLAFSARGNLEVPGIRIIYDCDWWP